MNLVFYITYNDEYVCFTYKVPTDKVVDIYNDKSVVVKRAEHKHDTQGQVIDTISIVNVFTMVVAYFKGKGKVTYAKEVA